jgi:hypothetical protein
MECVYDGRKYESILDLLDVDLSEDSKEIVFGIWDVDDLHEVRLTKKMVVGLATELLTLSKEMINEGESNAN